MQPSTVLLAAAILQVDAPDVDDAPEVLDPVWPELSLVTRFGLSFLLVVLVGWYLLVPGIRRLVARRNRNNPTLEDAIARYLRLFVFVVAIYAGVAVAGFSNFLLDSSLIVAAATLALGVAGQSVIGSLVSGTVLVVDPEFNVGDYVRWEGGEGTIRSITLRVTRVQTPDGELVTIPNEVLTDQAITRPFGHGRFQIVERVDLSFDDDLDDALTELEAAAVDLERSLDAPDPRAYVDELGDDAVVARVHFWIQDPDRRDVLAVQSAFAREVKRRLDGAGISISPAAQRELEGRIEVAETA